MTLPPIDQKHRALQQQLYGAGKKATATVASTSTIMPVKHIRVPTNRANNNNNNSTEDACMLTAYDSMSTDSSSSFESNGLTPVHQHSKENGNSDSLELNKSFVLPSSTGGIATTPTSRKASSSASPDQVVRGASMVAISVTTPEGSSSSSNNNMKRASTVSTTPAPTVGADVGSKVVCPVRLRAHQAKPRNKSPFDPRVYHPLIPPAVTALRHRLFLAVDLDETLVHATVVPIPSPSKVGRHNNRMPSFVTSVPQQQNADVPKGLIGATRGVSTAGYDFSLDLSAMTNGEQQEVILVKYRPHVQAFIDFICDRFEVAIFTASHKSYADPLIDHLDPSGRLGKIRLYREHCADVGGSKVKDLSLLGRPLHRIALLDNSPTSYFFQPRNGIPIVSWYDDPNDNELLKLMPLLDALSGANDVVDVLDTHHAVVGPPS